MTFDEIIAGKWDEKEHCIEGQKPRAPMIVCKDGTSLSVQASWFHHCTPCADRGPYSHVEVGFLSIVPPEEWARHADDWDMPTETIYNYVPVELVRQFIESHGGER